MDEGIIKFTRMRVFNCPVTGRFTALFRHASRNWNNRRCVLKADS